MIRHLPYRGRSSSEVAGGLVLALVLAALLLAFAAPAVAAAPSVLSVSPANGTGDIPVDTQVTVVFSQAMDPLTVGANSLKLLDGEETVPARALLDPGDRTMAYIYPAQVLDVGRTYTVVVGSGVADAHGVRLAAEFTSTFGTAATGVTPHGAYASYSNLCRHCHTPHGAAVADTSFGGPLLTQNKQTTLCYTCHDGTGASSDVQASFAESPDTRSGHLIEDSTTVPGAGLTTTCSSCHAPHYEEKSRPILHASTINGAAVTGANTSLCEACHNDTFDWVPRSPEYPYPSGGVIDPAKPLRSSTESTGYPIAGTFPGSTTYENAASNAHTAARWPGREDLGAGDCRTCHVSHRSDSRFDSLVAPFRPSPDAASAVADRQTGEYAALCFTCHDGDGPASANILQFVSADATDTAGTGGHRIRTAGGNLPVGAALPCYDCHNPHGSKGNDGVQPNKKLLSDEQWSGIDTSTPKGVVDFCFKCHLPWEYAAGSGQPEANTVPNGQLTKVEGLDRRVPGNGLSLPDSIAEHGKDNMASSTPMSCYNCHGNDYSSTGNNVHRPGAGLSTGGSDCYSCHAGYQANMEDGLGAKTGSARASVYHHVLGSVSYDGDKAFAAADYPTSTSEVYCLSCHVDHDKFNPPADKAGNLRASISGDEASATDYSSATGSGVCTDCHALPRVKRAVGEDQKDGGTTATPKILAGNDVGRFGDSAHSYETTSTFTDGSSFRANCSKCHNDENEKAYQDSTARFGLHWSAERSLLSALGGTLSDPLSEQGCYRCHRGGTAGEDYYASKAMTRSSRSVQAQFGLVSKHPVTPAANGSSVECENCHNPHVVNAAGATVSDPANTYDIAPYADTQDQVAFCLTCHSSGTLPQQTVTDGTYIPSTVVIAATDQPHMDKSAYGSRGHWSVSGSIAAGEEQSCAVCHDNHGSNYEKLLGVYDPATGANTVSGRAITGNDSSVCAACHDAPSTGYPATERDADNYPSAGRFPGYAVYSGAGGIHNVTTVKWEPASVGGACQNCHDVHGTANPYDQLRSPDAAPSYTAGDLDLCFNCHDEDGSATINIKQYYPADAGGSAVQGSATRFGHRTESAGTLAAGSALPCYDCHNPHGSAEAPYGLLVTTMTDNKTTVVLGDEAAELSVGTSAGVRRFCLSCHTTADTEPAGWNGSDYAAVGAGALVEGIDRTVRDEGNSRGLRLPRVPGHYRGDTLSCSGCHGADYGSPGGNNVHNPGPGGSAPPTDHTIGRPCAASGCHETDVTQIHFGRCQVCHGAGITPTLVCSTCHGSDPHSPTAPSTDRTPPHTSSDAAASYKGAATITLKATDVGSGVARTYFRLDGGTQTLGTMILVPAPASGSVAHSIEFWSVDRAGNVEAAHTASFTVAAGSITFIDVPPSHPNHDAITRLADRGVVQGYLLPDGRREFRPANSTLRAQVAKMMALFMDLPVDESLTSVFTDLGADNRNSLYIHEYIAAMADKRWMIGTSATTFSPWRQTTRAQLVTIVVRIARADQLLAAPPATFRGTFGNFSAAHAENMRWAEHNGLLQGIVGFGRAWDPLAPMTRAEVAQVLANLDAMMQ